MLGKTVLSTALSAVVAGAFMMGAARADVPESSEPIKIVTNNWTSQLVLAHVVGDLLMDMGYNVEYVPSDTQLQFTAIAAGDMDFQVEVWEGSMAESFDAAQADGLVDLGAHNAVTREDWWYPSYMNDLCPGLPDWKALDACAELFATAETAPKGRFVGPPADWGKHYSERIQALGMNYEEVAVGQAATLWAELQAAYDRQEPIVLFNWTPNFIEAKFDGEFVVFPEYDPACLTDPAWGMNPDAVYDCGAPASGYLKKAGSPRLAETWPAAYAFPQNVDFSNDQIAAAAAMVDVDGMTPEEAAEQWIQDNKDTWSAWTI
ncbi:MAG: ABC transporter substrate-binding protein [Proteobacteria bacterium]|nr:ABC transporter substrate-binding protein [Pseudomonadota bacterium]MDA0952265.1 ABC transporter substrate-binding protein [Pseudomonadota bacterium]